MDIPLPAFRDQLFKVGHGAELVHNILIIADVVAVVLVGGGVNGREPEQIYTQISQLDLVMEGNEINFDITADFGFNDSYEEYINNLNLVWKECNRILSDGCRLCINIGDQFARSVYYGRYKVIPIRTEIIRLT